MYYDVGLLFYNTFSFTLYSVLYSLYCHCCKNKLSIYLSSNITFCRCADGRSLKLLDGTLPVDCRIRPLTVFVTVTTHEDVRLTEPADAEDSGWDSATASGRQELFVQIL